MNIHTYLAQSARRYPQAPAVIAGSQWIATYEELARRARCLGAALRAGAGVGDRVLVATANCPQYIEILFGVWAAGMVVAPANAKLHPREMHQIIEDCAPAVIFASDEIAAKLMERDTATGLPRVVVIGSPAYESMLDGPEAAPIDVDSDALAWLFFTSGTTGRSKGAMLSHRNLATMAVAYLADFDCVETDHRLIHAAPLSHGSGLYVLPYVVRAAAQVVPESGGFDPEEFVQLCRQHSHCAAFLAPTMLSRLRSLVDETGIRPSNLRTVVYGGGPMYVTELVKSLDTFGNVLIQLYGQGEAPMTITGLRKADHLSRDPAILGSVGWARSGVEVAVVDVHDQRMAPGEIGEVICRGDVVMKGYWNLPEETRKALHGGWLRTGDMGYQDADGKLTLRDRSKDVIISGGSNIYPREVEDVLLMHPGVAECSVVGKRDLEWGESIVAFVVRRPGTAVTERELDEHCLEFIARFKRPKVYRFVSELPKNNYGKIVKRELSARLLSEEN